MNLYKIEVEHFSQKDSHKSIECLLLAENDEQVYEWMKGEPKIDGSTMYNSWKDIEEEEEEDGEKHDLYDGEYNVIGQETFKEKMIRVKGQMNDEDYEVSDRYYGVTLHGWSIASEDVQTNYDELINVGLVFVAPPLNNTADTK